MKKDRTQKIVWAGLFTSMTAIATLVIRIPSPLGGYVNTGDALVILSAFLLSPVWGAVAAGLGSALADIFSGYAIYAPATFIIKALMALSAGWVLSRAKNKKFLKSAIFGSILAELIMIFGYFSFDALFMGYGWGALVNIPGNCVQAVFGAAAGTSLFYALLRIPYVRETF
jgi:uncharacterized membrane protein